MTLLFTTLAEPIGGLPSPPRLSSGFAQFDRATGGGLPPGTTFLLAGDPGAGKSTLLLQVAARVALAQPHTAAYITGEETVEAIQALAVRLSLTAAPVRLAATADVPAVLAALTPCRPKTTFLVIDSIQRMIDPTLRQPAGSLCQMRAVLARLIAFAHDTQATIAIICHVTKQRSAAGPNELQHDVDAVFYFEAARQYRLLRPTKNRFGPTTPETFGVFAMTTAGLIE